MTKENLGKAANFAAENTKLVGSVLMGGLSSMMGGKKKEEPPKKQDEDFMSNFANIKF